MSNCEELPLVAGGRKFARLLSILAVGAGILGASARVQAQTEAAKLYEHHCVKCHGADGTGKPARPIEPNIPDFRAGSWQAKRTDKQLLESILDGKGQTMPGFRTRKISEEQARALVTHVRAFAPATKKSNLQEANEPDSDGFEQRFRCLQEEFETLQKQFRQLSQAPPDGKLSPKNARSAAPAKPTNCQPPAPPESSAPAATKKPAFLRAEGRGVRGEEISRPSPLTSRPSIARSPS